MERNRQIEHGALKEESTGQDLFVREGGEWRRIPKCLARKAGWIILPFTKMGLTMGGTGLGRNQVLTFYQELKVIVWFGINFVGCCPFLWQKPSLWPCLAYLVLVSTIWALSFPEHLLWEQKSSDCGHQDVIQTRGTGQRVSSWCRDHGCVSQYPSCNLFWGSLYLQVPCLAWLASNSHLAWPVVTKLGLRPFAALFMVSPGSSYLLCSSYVLAFGLCLSLCDMWWGGCWILAPGWFSWWANGQRKALGEGRAETWEEKS